MDHNAYPDAFPPLMRSAAWELHQNCGVPIEMAAPLVLGTASLACQGSVDVTRPNCDPSPSLLFTLVVAGSGTRKSTVINKLLAPFREIENEIADQVAMDAPTYEAACLTWELRKKSLVQQTEQEARKGDVSKETQVLLAAHFAARPERRVVPKFVYEDPTPEAVVNGLCQTWNSAAVVSAEAANFLNGRASHDLALWNRIWDGAGVGVERIGRGAMFSRAARGSLILAVQERPFEDFREARGSAAMDIGFLARFLISRPPSMIGNRILTETSVGASWKGLSRFHERVKNILIDQIAKNRDGSSDRINLHFSPSAKKRWIAMFNEVEEKTKPWGYLESIPGYASKICENVARVAATFHFFEGRDGELIDENDIVNAGKIVGWHTDDFIKTFGKDGQVTIEQRDTKALENWLLAHVWQAHKPYIQKNFIRQFGPNQLRSKLRLDNALQLLVLENIIQIRQDSSKTRIVELNPNHFGKTRWHGNGI